MHLYRSLLEQGLASEDGTSFAAFSSFPSVPEDEADLLFRFAEVEGTAVISMLVRNYRMEIKNDPKFAGETFAQRKVRVLKCSSFLTVTPDGIPVTFTRRQ
jgi:hypothetical protein